MIASARNAYILKRLEESGIIDYKNISKELQVSEATVRRDFEKLELNGMLRRVQGGAVRNDELLMGELSVIAKNTVHAEEKLEIARAAAQEVQEGENIFLDCGTSIAALGRFLLHKRIHIVTNNNLLLSLVQQNTPADVFMLGGRFSAADQMFVGPLTETMLSSFTFHRAFIGCMGMNFEKDAVYVTDMECLAIKKMAMRNAERNILLTDLSKENKHGLFRLAGCTEFDRIYVNAGISTAPLPENVTAV